MVHIYYGDGKGKTTAAVGAAVRAAGRGRFVGFCEFLKDGSSGECAVLRRLAGVTVFDAPSPMPFTFQMTAEDRDRIAGFYRSQLADMQAALPKLDLLVLDEALDGAAAGLVCEETLLSLVRRHPEKEIILTGHTLPSAWAKTADYLTEMRKQRHPYDHGIAGREGIEW